MLIKFVYFKLMINVIDMLNNLMILLYLMLTFILFKLIGKRMGIRHTCF